MNIKEKLYLFEDKIFALYGWVDCDPNIIEKIINLFGDSWYKNIDNQIG
jgi:hypothetical protein